MFDRRFLSVNPPAHTKGCVELGSAAAGPLIADALGETNKYVGRNVLSAIRHLLASDVLNPDVLLTERVCRAYISLGFWSECEEFQHEMASLCPDQSSMGISSVTVEVLLQKGDLEKAIGLTGELFPFTDDVMSRDTHSVLVHLVAEALRRILVSLLLEQAFTTRHHDKFFVGVIHDCALLGNRAVCEEVEKLVGTDYILQRKRAALIRTYGTFNDSRRLLSSAREATAELPEVLFSSDGRSHSYVQRDLGRALVATLMWLAHICCSLQATWKGSVQAPEKSTLRCCVLYQSYLSGVDAFQDSLAEKLFIDAALHMSLGQFGRKNSCHDPVHERKPY